MCMGYGRDIKAWLAERDRQDANGMLEAWGAVLGAVSDAPPQSAASRPCVARAGQGDPLDRLTHVEGEPA